MVRLLVSAFCFALAIIPARAVVVSGSNDGVETQAPTSNDFGFANVGIVNNFIAGIPATGVYLGDGWVISAFHNVSNASFQFAFTGAIFGGIGYSVDPTTARRLHNPDNSLADLAMFRLTSEPPLLGASLSGTTPIATTAVRMMGNGQDREPDETGWNLAWQEVGPGGFYKGYNLINARSMRWGTNTVSTATLLTLNTGFGSVRAFGMNFDNTSGDGVVTGGDSGGGVFVETGGSWKLAGVLVAAAPLSGQPAGTVAYGDVSYAANIATYRAEIENVMATVPEPSSLALLLSSALLLPRRRRCRRSQA